jgi:hypothetical protein
MEIWVKIKQLISIRFCGYIDEEWRSTIANPLLPIREK